MKHSHETHEKRGSGVHGSKVQGYLALVYFMKKVAGPIAIAMPQCPNPDEPELKIGDCRLNI